MSCARRRVGIATTPVRRWDRRCGPRWCGRAGPARRPTGRKWWWRCGSAWAVLGAPTGKRLASVLVVLVATLRRFDELAVSDATAALLVAMSPATIDRRLAPDRAAMSLRGRSHTKPGSSMSALRT